MTVETTAEGAAAIAKVMEVIRGLRGRQTLTKHAIVNALADIGEVLGEFIAVDADDVIGAVVRDERDGHVWPSIKAFLKDGLEVIVDYNGLTGRYEISITRAACECDCSCGP